MELVEKDIKPRDIATEKAFRNAITVDMALGCSTNTSLHIPAIAHEAGIKIDLRQFNEISEVTPNLCHLAPAGEHFMEELDAAGGVRAVMKELDGIGLIEADVLTVTGKTVGENIADAVNADPEVIRPVENAYSKDRRPRLPLREHSQKTAVWSSAARSRLRCAYTPAAPACLTARTPQSKPYTVAR